jgi:hypothetical protein
MLMRVFRVILIFLVLYHSIYSEYNKIYCIFISAGKNEWNAILNGLEKSVGFNTNNIKQESSPHFSY